MVHVGLQRPLRGVWLLLGQDVKPPIVKGDMVWIPSDPKTTA